LNAYDDCRPDIERLLKEQDARVRPPDPAARSGDGLGVWGRLISLARLYALGASVKTGLHRRLVYANIRLGWFMEFQQYWVEELRNRPIHPHDFYFLAGSYRRRAQEIGLDPDEAAAGVSDDKHLEAWRDPALVYYLFAHTYRLALSPLRVHPFTRFLPRGGRVAEYGCGNAPMLTGLARYYRHLNLHLVGADIPHLLFHCARWKFRHDRFVTMVPIAPSDDAPLPGHYDAIFCLEVLEHLPRPIPVLTHLHDALKPGGHFIFDYFRSEGTGLDTAAGLRDRLPALRFILDHFEVVRGDVPIDGSHVQPAVARKLAGCPRQAC
jgi:SAM-dependent methyltransferase